MKRLSCRGRHGSERMPRRLRRGTAQRVQRPVGDRRRCLGRPARWRNTQAGGLPLARARAPTARIAVEPSRSMRLPLPARAPNSPSEVPLWLVMPGSARILPPLPGRPCCYLGAPRDDADNDLVSRSHGGESDRSPPHLRPSRGRPRPGGGAWLCAERPSSPWAGPVPGRPCAAGQHDRDACRHSPAWLPASSARNGRARALREAP